MKNLILLSLCISLTFPAFSQLKIIANGKVGINEDNPLSQIHITHDVHATFQIENTGSGPSTFKFGNANTLWRFFLGSDNSFRIANLTNSKNIFFLDPNAPSQSLYVKTTGVGIGTSTPSEKLHVVGNILATGTITSSDKRLKSKISKFNLGLKEVLKIQPRTYFYNGKANIESDLLHVGVLAQEFEKIVPIAVGDYNHYNYNDSTDKSIYEDTYKWVNEGVIKYMLVNAIKDQQTIINEQEEIITDMVNRMERIENQLAELIKNGTINEHSISLEDNDNTILGQNVPNPFSEFTNIEYNIPLHAQKAVIEFYNAEGRVLKTFNIENFGKSNLNINSIDLPAGVFNYRLIVDNKIIDTKQMVKMK